MHPGYNPPSRQKHSNEILNECHESLVQSCKGSMEGKEVPLCLDGWTNVSNDSIISSSFIHNGKVYIAETTDASAVKHTSDNLAEIALQHKKNLC